MSYTQFRYRSYDEYLREQLGPPEDDEEPEQDSSAPLYHWRDGSLVQQNFHPRREGSDEPHPVIPSDGRPALESSDAGLPLAESYRLLYELRSELWPSLGGGFLFCALLLAILFLGTVAGGAH